MKLSLRAGYIAVFVYTAISAASIHQAFVGRVPNESGMLVAIFAHPTYFLFTPFYEALRTFSAAWLHQPVDDRFAMEFDAMTGWLIGCVQYGFIGAIVHGMWRSVRQSAAADAKQRRG